MRLPMLRWSPNQAGRPSREASKVSGSGGQCAAPSAPIVGFHSSVQFQRLETPNAMSRNTGFDADPARGSPPGGADSCAGAPGRRVPTGHLNGTGDDGVAGRKELPAFGAGERAVLIAPRPVPGVVHVQVPLRQIHLCHPANVGHGLPADDLSWRCMDAIGGPRHRGCKRCEASGWAPAVRFGSASLPWRRSPPLLRPDRRGSGPFRTRPVGMRANFQAARAVKAVWCAGLPQPLEMSHQHVLISA